MISKRLSASGRPCISLACMLDLIRHANFISENETTGETEVPSAEVDAVRRQ